MFILTACLFFGVLCLIAVFNYSLDAYGIFRTSYEDQVLEPNKNYVKTKYVIDHKEEYDSFLFGSSRVGHIETQDVEEGNYYNMCYSEGLPADWLVTIETLLENDVKIQNVMLGIDDFSFMIDPKQHTKDLLRIYYRDLDWFAKMKYYVLRNPFDVYNVKTIRNLLEHQPVFMVTDDFIGSGVAYGNDDYVEAHMEEHLQDPKFLTAIDFYQMDRVDATIEEIQQIITLCEENGITLRIFFNPIHQATYGMHQELTERAKEELAKITDYWDFSGLNDITTNNYYWYETSHYRHIVGKMMLERMGLHDFDIEVPENFGVYLPRA